jgi:hypothetical protein
MTQGVEHTHGVGAPRAAYVWGACHTLQRQRKTLIAYSEILGAVVEAAMHTLACGHASTSASAFFKHMHAVSCLDQSACGGDAGHAGSDDGDVQSHALLYTVLTVF